MTESANIQVPTETSVVNRIRPEVRAERQYRVSRFAHIDTKLNQNESPFDLPDAIKAEILEELRSVPFNRYPNDQPTALQNALAIHLGCDPDSILVGNGSNELTHTLGVSLIAGGGRAVLPSPLFALFRSVVRLFGGELTEVPPRQDLSFDTDAIVAAIHRVDPQLTVLATPNNPTGLEMSHAEVRRVVEAAKGFVVIDEAYVEFGEEPDALSLLRGHPNVIIMRTLSKGFGLAGLRIGYLVARPAVVSELLKARLPFMIGELAQLAAVRMLREPDLIGSRVAAMQESVNELFDALSRLGLQPVPSKANFVLFKSPASPANLVEKMAGRGVLIRDMSGYKELRGYVRVCAGTTAENKAFLDALTKILDH